MNIYVIKRYLQKQRVIYREAVLSVKNILFPFVLVVILSLQFSHIKNGTLGNPKREVRDDKAFSLIHLFGKKV